MTRELVDQLHVDQASVLPIPRPPCSLLRAQISGPIAREELALQAFVSATLRRFRTEVGEPEVAIAALTSGALGLRFSSPFIEERVSVHRRALHPTEDVNEAAQSMLALLRECALTAIALLPDVVDDARFSVSPANPLH
jgi:hypothetical protein